MPAINQGEVAITLDGKEVVLRCSLAASKEIDVIFGGAFGAIERLRSGGIGAFSSVIAAGARLNRTDDLDDKIYRNGLTPLAGPLVKWLTLLHNGGRDLSEKGDATEGEA